MPNAANRKEVEGRIKTLDKQIADQKQVDLTTPAPQVDLTTPAPQSEEPGRPIYKKWWFWAGSAAAILVVGGVIAAGANKAPSTPLGL